MLLTSVIQRGGHVVRLGAAGVLLGLMMGGCSSGETTGSLSAEHNFVPIALPTFGPQAPGKPSEVYVRLARLVKACWLMPPSPLGVGFVFAADVDPDARGGAAHIVIFNANSGQVRGSNAERGPVAYEISLSANGDNTAIGIENTRIPDAIANQMKSDVARWAEGDPSCRPSAPWPSEATTGETAVTISKAADAKNRLVRTRSQ